MAPKGVGPEQQYIDAKYERPNTEPEVGEAAVAVIVKPKSQVCVVREEHQEQQRKVVSYLLLLILAILLLSKFLNNVISFILANMYMPKQAIILISTYFNLKAT